MKQLQLCFNFFRKFCRNVFLLLGLGLIWTIATWVISPVAAIASSGNQPILAVGSLFSFSGDRPTNLGVTNGKLATCPPRPNCVSSQSQDQQHQIQPLQYEGTPIAAMQRLQTLIAELPRAEIITATENYLYAEFTSALMGFVDDVEFFVDPVNPVIQVRSASRLGESDLGVNRKRIDAIRNQFNPLSFTITPYTDSNTIAP